MSNWKSKLWSITKTVGAKVGYALVGWALDKYASKPVASAVHEVLDDLVNGKPMAPTLQGHVDEFFAKQHPETSAENLDKLRQMLGPRIAPPALPSRGKK